jgi:hypothetical protein
MARIYSDTIMDQVAYAATSNAAMVNLEHGQQMGPSVDFRNFVSNAAYVKRNIIPFLIEAPRGFQDLDRPDYYVGALKSLVELAPMQIDGLNAGIRVAVTETAVGGAGEMQQDPTNVTRDRSEPSFQWKDKYGAAVQKFLESWVTNLIMDPNTKVPRIIAAGVRPADLLPDYYCMTMLFVEPDPSGTRVIRSWLIVNMFPIEGIEVTGRRAITEDMQEAEYTVRFTGMAQVGEGVDNFAQQLLNSLTFTGLNANTQASFVTALDPNVTSAGFGWSDMLSDLATDQVTGPVDTFTSSNTISGSQQ